jgi:hypothetical protein
MPYVFLKRRNPEPVEWYLHQAKGGHDTNAGGDYDAERAESYSCSPVQLRIHLPERMTQSIGKLRSESDRHVKVVKSERTEMLSESLR